MPGRRPQTKRSTSAAPTPSWTTVEEIERTYLEAWRLGLKAIAIYRDGRKKTRPLSTGKDVKAQPASAATAAPAPQLRCRKLPDTRHSVTHKFSVSGFEGYLTVGLYEEGKPGEICITLGKAGAPIMEEFVDPKEAGLLRYWRQVKGH